MLSPPVLMVTFTEPSIFALIVELFAIVIGASTVTVFPTIQLLDFSMCELAP